MRLNQITVGSTDLDRAERFYRLLGLRLIVKTDDYLRFECPDGDSTFSVERASQAATGEQVTIYFEADDLDDQYQRLRGSVEFTQPPTDMPWLWREARLYDPDGHRLCLFHAGPARRNPPWRLPPGGSARLDEGEAKLGPPHQHGGSARPDEGEAKLGPPQEAQDLP